MKKRPEKSTTNPVTAGAMMPARFPRKFWKPVHRPAIRGPASVCVMAQILDPHMPPVTNASSSRITEIVGPASAQPRRSSPALPAPTPAIDLRTSGGDPPVGDPAEHRGACGIAQIPEANDLNHRAHCKVPLSLQVVR